MSVKVITIKVKLTDDELSLLIEAIKYVPLTLPMGLTSLISAKHKLKIARGRLKKLNERCG